MFHGEQRYSDTGSHATGKALSLLDEIGLARRSDSGMTGTAEGVRLPGTPGLACLAWIQFEHDSFCSARLREKAMSRMSVRRCYERCRPRSSPAAKK